MEGSFFMMFIGHIMINVWLMMYFTGGLGLLKDSGSSRAQDTTPGRCPHWCLKKRNIGRWGMGRFGHGCSKHSLIEVLRLKFFWGHLVLCLNCQSDDLMNLLKQTCCRNVLSLSVINTPIEQTCCQ